MQNHRLLAVLFVCVTSAPGYSGDRFVDSFTTLSVSDDGSVCCGIQRHYQNREHAYAVLFRDSIKSEPFVVSGMWSPRWSPGAEKLIAVAPGKGLQIASPDDRMTKTVVLDVPDYAGRRLEVNAFSLIHGAKDTIFAHCFADGKTATSMILECDLSTSKVRRVCGLGGGASEFRALSASSLGAGRIVVAAHHEEGEDLLSRKRIHSLFVREAASGEAVSMLGIAEEDAYIAGCAMSRDGQWVAVATQSFSWESLRIQCSLWDARKGTVVAQKLAEVTVPISEGAHIGHNRESVISFAADSKSVAFALEHNAVQVYSVPQGRFLGHVSKQKERFVSVSLGPGDKVLAGTDNLDVFEWRNLEDRKPTVVNLKNLVHPEQ